MFLLGRQNSNSRVGQQVRCIIYEKNHHAHFDIGWTQFLIESEVKTAFVGSLRTANFNDTFNEYKLKIKLLTNKTKKGKEKKNKNLQKPFKIWAGVLFRDWCTERYKEVLKQMFFSIHLFR